MNQPIVVLGASGFIGRAVAAELLRTDWAHTILGVRRRMNATGAYPAPEQRIIEATSVKSLSAAVQDAAAVVHCVAGDARTMVASASALVEATAHRSPPPRIIYLSSMAVYGSAEGTLDESAPLRGDIGPYSQAKVAAEAIIARHPRAVILRPGCVFGPGSEQWSIRMARLLLARRLGDLGAAGDGCCNLVHIDDVVRAILRCIAGTDTDGRIFNLSAAAPTWNEFLTAYALALRAVPVRRISARRLRLETKLLAPPLKVAEILARAGGVAARHLPPPIPPSLVRLMGQDIRLDSRAAETALGIRWKDATSSIDGTAQWFAQQYRSG